MDEKDRMMRKEQYVEDKKILSSSTATFYLDNCPWHVLKIEKLRVSDEGESFHLEDAG